MVVVANIDLWGHFVGAVLLDKSTGVASLEFDPAFLRNSLDIAPLTMPLSEARGDEFSVSRDYRLIHLPDSPDF